MQRKRCGKAMARYEPSLCAPEVLPSVGGLLPIILQRRAATNIPREGFGA